MYFVWVKKTERWLSADAILYLNYASVLAFAPLCSGEHRRCSSPSAQIFAVPGVVKTLDAASWRGPASSDKRQL